MPGLLDLQNAAALLAEFRAPPTRHNFERIGIYPQTGAYFFDRNLGTWRVVYERGHLPTPGAMAYAYMSLGLGPVDICGPGIDVQGGGFNAFQPPQTYSPQAVGVQGVGTTAGQVFTSPLTVPKK